MDLALFDFDAGNKERSDPTPGLIGVNARRPRRRRRRPRRVRVALLIATLLGASAPCAAGAGACPGQIAVVSPAARPQPAAAFRGISTTLTVREIVDRLGPAARDVGSGLYLLEWDVIDGRIFLVSTTSACERPLSVGFRRR